MAAYPLGRVVVEIVIEQRRPGGEADGITGVGEVQNNIIQPFQISTG